jgi:hypothetical protein
VPSVVSFMPHLPLLLVYLTSTQSESDLCDTIFSCIFNESLPKCTFKLCQICLFILAHVTTHEPLTGFPFRSIFGARGGALF